MILRFLHGLSVAETVQIMGNNDGVIKTLQRRAIRADVREVVQRSNRQGSQIDDHPDPARVPPAVPAGGTAVQGTTADPAFTETPGTLAFVAAQGEEVLGWCWGYQLVRPDSSSMTYLHELQVAEEHRHKGIGRELLQAFLAVGREAGAYKMLLITDTANTSARSLYEASGCTLSEEGPTVTYDFSLTTASQEHVDYGTQ